MKENLTLETTGEIRSYLLQMLHRVENGSVPLDKADRLCKIVARIHESIHCENRTRLVQMAAGEHLQTFGTLLVGSIPAPSKSLAPPSQPVLGHQSE